LPRGALRGRMDGLASAFAPALLMVVALVAWGSLVLGCARAITFGPASEPRGLTPPTYLRFTLETDAAHAAAARAYASQFALLGLRVAVEILPWEELQRRAAAGESDACLVGWSGSSPEPLGIVAAKLTRQGESNFSGYSSAEMARLLTGVAAGPSAAQRLACALAAQEFLQEEAPWVYGVEAPLSDAAAGVLSGWFPGPAGAAVLRDARISSPGGRLAVGLGLDAWPSLNPLHPIDPQAATIFRCLFDSLCAMGPDGEISPELAESWEFSADARRLVVHLRDDVLFHDGRPLRPADVVYTYEQTLPGRLPEGTEVSVAGGSGNSVVFRFSAPFAGFLALHGLQPIASAQSVVAGAKALAANPVGTGPFRLVEERQRSGRQIVLTRWDGYYGNRRSAKTNEPSKVEEIVFALAPDVARRAAMLKSGQIAFAPALGPEAVRAFSDLPDVSIAREPGWTIVALELNTRRPPFDDARVRLALNFGLNRQVLASALGEGTEIVPNAFFPDGAGFSPGVGSFSYDPERACALLRAAGYLTTSGP
jgi:ABC-type transport system substrate-binding protein